MTTNREQSQPATTPSYAPDDRAPDRLATVTLRVFQFAAYAEGGLLPAVLAAAIAQWLSGRGGAVVVLIGATHGAVFTVYILLVTPVARLLSWPWRTASIALSVAFVPFAPWSFERRIRGELTQRIRQRPHDSLE
jgi:integral membrane protein